MELAETEDESGIIEYRAEDDYARIRNRPANLAFTTEAVCSAYPGIQRIDECQSRMTLTRRCGSQQTSEPDRKTRSRPFRMLQEVLVGAVSCREVTMGMQRT